VYPKFAGELVKPVNDNTVVTTNASKTTVKEPPVKTQPIVDEEVVSSIDPDTLGDSYVYVHCHVGTLEEGMLIRIWRTTFLIDHALGTKSGLIHAENISFAPHWTMIPGKGQYTFLLIFSALAKSCKVFDLVEEIPQPGGFEVKGIRRNETDIYHVNIL